MLFANCIISNLSFSYSVSSKLCSGNTAILELKCIRYDLNARFINFNIKNLGGCVLLKAVTGNISVKECWGNTCIFNLKLIARKLEYRSLKSKL